MPALFSKMKNTVITYIQTEVPFIIRMLSKGMTLVFFLGLFVYGLQTNNNSFGSTLPAFYVIVNLLLETLFYRIFKMKESRFQKESLLKTVFMVSPYQLDQAALKTNTVKWISLILFLSMSTGGFFIFDLAPEIFLIAIYTCALVGTFFIYPGIPKTLRNRPYMPIPGTVDPLNPPFQKDYMKNDITDPCTGLGHWFFTNIILPKR